MKLLRDAICIVNDMCGTLIHLLDESNHYRCLRIAGALLRNSWRAAL